MDWPNYFAYWGKSRREESSGESYHLLAFHCLDVAAVGMHLLQANRPLREAFAKLSELDEVELIRWFVFFLVLHDLGKFAVSFQQFDSNSTSAKSSHRISVRLTNAY